MIQDYQQAIDYLYQNLPIFQRVGAVAIKKGLTNTVELCEALGNPQQKFRSIHVGGTNGKGSTSHMLAAVLQCSGYKTGLYTSPHLIDFTERIRVNGVTADKQFVVEFVNKVRPLIDRIQPSFFEITVAMAFEYFAKQKVDVAIIEVGLGGRLDSTNIIRPILSVITNIGMDHMDILGDTLDKIASEKAGIIKDNVPVVISERQDIAEIFVQAAKEHHAPIYFASDSFSAEIKDEELTILKKGKTFLSDIELDLKGDYQHQNILGVVQAVDLLRELNFELTDILVREGLRNVTSLTGLKGRWQKLGDKPLVVCDTGHNAEGIKYIVKQIHKQNWQTLHMVIGMVKDKDIAKVLSLLPKEAHYYFCQSKIPRAMDANELQAKAKEFGLIGVIIPDVNEAISHAKKRATPADMIFIGGSTFVVAEIAEL